VRPFHGCGAGPANAGQNACSRLNWSEPCKVTPRYWNF
jgi:hypothetical protein